MGLLKYKLDQPLQPQPHLIEVVKLLGAVLDHESQDFPSPRVSYLRNVGVEILHHGDDFGREPLLSHQADQHLVGGGPPIHLHFLGGVLDAAILVQVVGALHPVPCRDIIPSEALPLAPYPIVARAPKHFVGLEVLLAPVGTLADVALVNFLQGIVGGGKLAVAGYGIRLQEGALGGGGAVLYMVEVVEAVEHVTRHVVVHFGALTGGFVHRAMVTVLVHVLLAAG